MKNKILKIIGGGLIAALLLVLAAGPAHAAAVTINITGITDHTGGALPAGAFVQVIQSGDSTRGNPGTDGLPSGDTVVVTGTINPDGTFSSAASIPSNQFVYIRVWETWDGTGNPPAGTYYGQGPAEDVGTGFVYTYDPAGFSTSTQTQVSITNVSPNSGNQGQTSLSVTITGANVDWSGTPTISFSGTGITVSNPQTTDSTHVTCTIAIDAAAATGARNVTVNGVTGTGMFTVNAGATPSISNVSPNSGDQGQTSLSVTITGANVDWSGVTTTDVSFGTGITITDVSITSATEIIATIDIASDATEGARDVIVDGTTGPGMFTVNSGSSNGITVIDDFEGTHVGDFTSPEAHSGYYTFDNGITPNNTNINADGPSATNPHEGSQAMHMQFSVSGASAGDYGGGWGAILISPVDLSTAVMVSVRINGDGSGNYVRLELKESDGDSLASSDPNDYTTAIHLDFTGYQEFTFSTSDFVVNPDPASSTGDGTMQWDISGYNLIYFTGDNAITVYHDVDYLIAYDASAALLSVSPSSLSFDAGSGAAPAAQNIAISNSGSATLNWTASSEAGWIVLGSTSGTTPASLEVSVDTTGLSKGDFTGSITIASDDALNSPITVPVTLSLGTGVEITSIEPAIGPAGSTIICYGTLFGNDQGNSSLQFIADNGTSTQAVIKSWSDSRIEAIVPAGLAKGDYEIKVFKIMIVQDTLRAYESNREAFEITANTTPGRATIYPNPFNPNGGEVSNIVFDPGTASTIGVYIYDMTAHLVYQDNLTSGTTNCTWNGYSQSPRMKVGDGVYLLRIINEDNKALIAKGKILVVKQ